MCGCGVTAETRRTNAAMCVLCPELGMRVRADWSTVAVCTVDGRAFGPRGERREACPRGRHADEQGMVRWLGSRWRGVPYPLRVRLRRRGVELKRGPLPGCGCIDRVKAWTEGVGERVKRAWGVWAVVLQPVPDGLDD